MNEHIVLIVMLVVLLVGQLVIGGVCIYRMKRDWRRAVEQRHVFTVGDVATMEQVRNSIARSQRYGGGGCC